jgi:hypothetical protein
MGDQKWPPYYAQALFSSVWDRAALILPFHTQDAAHTKAPIVFKQRQVCAVALRLADAVVAKARGPAGMGRSGSEPAGVIAVPVGAAYKHIPFPPKLDSISAASMHQQARTGTFCHRINCWVVVCLSMP